ncbi:Prmt7, partial [Symbiodinium sp. CCMP2456]
MVHAQVPHAPSNAVSWLWTIALLAWLCPIWHTFCGSCRTSRCPSEGSLRSLPRRQLLLAAALPEDRSCSCCLQDFCRCPATCECLRVLRANGYKTPLDAGEALEQGGEVLLSASLKWPRGDFPAWRPLEAQLAVRNSTLPGAGQGLFAAEAIAAGVVLPPYQGLSLLFADLDRVEYSREVDNYVWCPRDRKLEGEPWLPSFCVDGQRLQRGNPARFVNAARMANQCDDVNLEICELGRVAYFRTLRPVSAGTELIVDYGSSYWEDFAVSSSVLAAMASLDGFLGHFDMLFDDDRNRAYAAAIRSAAEELRRAKPSQALRALDLGSGSGLLGLLCWQTGLFEQVVLIEACPPLAEAARENIRRNGAERCCSVWEGHSFELLHDEKAKVLIGEGVLPTLRHAAASRCFNPGPELIPRRAQVFGRVFRSKALWERHRGAFQDSSLVSLPEDVVRCPGLHAAEHIHLGPFLETGLLEFVSEPFEVFDFDFAAVTALPSCGRRVALRVPLKPGEAHGVALWFEAELFGSVRISTSPGQPLREHWRQAALCFRTPVAVEGSEPLELEAHHDDDAVWISLPRRSRQKLQPGRPPTCSCGLHAATSRRRLGALGVEGAWTVDLPKAEKGCGALVLGDGPILAIRLARHGYDPVVSVGPGMLNSSIIQKFASSNGLQEVLKAALLVGDIVPEGEETKRKHRRTDVRTVQKRQTDESEADSLEDLEDFQWAALAESLEAFDVNWAAFSDFWYEAAAEDWRFHHYAIFAQSLHALETAGLKVHAPPCSWTLHAAAFESEWLARRLRPVPNDLDPWQGIDLRALNALHAGQPKSGFSADVFPLVSANMLRIVSRSAEVLQLSCRWDRLEDWQSIELSVQRPAHGVLLWIQPKVLAATDIKWYDALTSGEAMSLLRHERFGVVLAEAAACETVRVGARKRPPGSSDHDVELYEIISRAGCYGELLEVLEGPRLEKTAEVSKAKGKAKKDDKVGSVLFKDESGKCFFELLDVLLCKGCVALTDNFDIGACKAIRKLEVGEKLQALEEPREDAKRHLVRMKVKALSDGKEGWATSQGNQGTMYVAANNRHYTCIHSVDLEPISGQVRRLEPGEHFELLQDPTTESREGKLFARGRCLSSSAQVGEGWFAVDEAVQPWIHRQKCAKDATLRTSMDADAEVVRELAAGEDVEICQAPEPSASSEGGALMVRVRAKKDGVAGFLPLFGEDGQ